MDARGGADGSVARYDWDFGDGTTADNGVPTPTRTYGTLTLTAEESQELNRTVTLSATCDERIASARATA